MDSLDSSKLYNIDDVSDEEEKFCIESIQKGDKEAFKKLFESYYEPLLCFAFRYVESRADAEEVVQDLFLWIWEKKEGWEIKEGLKSYLFSAVKYKCLDRIRHNDVKKKSIQEYTREIQQNNFNTSYQEKRNSVTEFESKAKQAIEMLPERAKMVYKLSRLEGLTYKEIAEVLEISPKTVESQMSRSLEFLRTHLSKYMGLLIAVKKTVDLLF